MRSVTNWPSGRAEKIKYGHEKDDIRVAPRHVDASRNTLLVTSVVFYY